MAQSELAAKGFTENVGFQPMKPSWNDGFSLQVCLLYYFKQMVDMTRKIFAFFAPVKLSYAGKTNSQQKNGYGIFMKVWPFNEYFVPFKIIPFTFHDEHITFSLFILF